jgi:hypothetical protein
MLKSDSRAELSFLQFFLHPKNLSDSHNFSVADNPGVNSIGGNRNAECGQFYGVSRSQTTRLSTISYRSFFLPHQHPASCREDN